MINHLAVLNKNFPGRANRTRCFAHVINLVVKSVLKQFDIPNKQVDRVLDDAEKELEILAKDLEDEEEWAREEIEGEGDEDETDDDIEGLVDEGETLDEEQRAELRIAVLPVRMMLTKVRYILLSQHW
jgi:hypothetical protein